MKSEQKSLKELLSNKDDSDKVASYSDISDLKKEDSELSRGEEIKITLDYGDIKELYKRDFMVKDNILFSKINALENKTVDDLREGEDLDSIIGYVGYPVPTIFENRKAKWITAIKDYIVIAEYDEPEFGEWIDGELEHCEYILNEIDISEDDDSKEGSSMKKLSYYWTSGERDVLKGFKREFDKFSCNKEYTHEDLFNWVKKFIKTIGKQRKNFENTDFYYTLEYFDGCLFMLSIIEREIHHRYLK